MAYRTVVRLSRNQQCPTYYGRINIASAFLSEQLPSGSQQRNNHNGRNGHQGGQQGFNGRWSQSFKVGAGFCIAAPVIVAGIRSQALLAEEDEKKRHGVEVRNSAESAVYAAETLIKENEDKISPDLKAEMDTTIQSVRTVLEGEDVSLIESSLQQLQETVQKVGQEVYSNAGEPSEGAGFADSETTDQDPDNTVEGEFREV